MHSSKIIISLIMASLFLLNFHARTQSIHEKGILYTEVSLKKGDSKPIKLGASMSEVHLHFGVPDSLQTFYGEISEKYMTIFYYGSHANTLVFEDGAGLTEFYIFTEEGFSVGIGEKFITKGDSADEVNNKIPFAIKHFNDGWFFRLLRENGEQATEGGLIIAYNQSVDKVISFGVAIE